MAYMTRPTGVNIVAAIMALYGVITIITTLGLFGIGIDFLAMILLGFGVLQLIFAGGLMSLAGWARTGTIILQVLQVIFGVLNLIGGSASAIQLVYTIVAIGIVIYLSNDSEVQVAFDKGY